MKGNSVIYDGRWVSTDAFRVFVYGQDGRKKVVESWEEYQAAIKSGAWHCECPLKKDIYDPVKDEQELTDKIEKAITRKTKSKGA